MKKKNLSKNINIICVLLFGIMCFPSCTPREEESKLSGSYEKNLSHTKKVLSCIMNIPRQIMRYLLNSEMANQIRGARNAYP
ncbi:hypothetical protein [Sphingobacterium bovisgrunnientis]|jgi:hypothetical protein|uniref:hypothetical protein n=1 Tax=Sphingobacterium bovisgrunnientis TaxID=1874697 RepID=UPI00135AEFD1|nr:hypothetical protein [Sphingobacterium bovisgrunnientis]